MKGIKLAGSGIIFLIIAGIVLANYFGYIHLFAVTVTEAANCKMGIENYATITCLEGPEASVTLQYGSDGTIIPPNVWSTLEGWKDDLRSSSIIDTWTTGQPSPQTLCSWIPTLSNVACSYVKIEVRDKTDNSLKCSGDKYWRKDVLGTIYVVTDTLANCKNIGMEYGHNYELKIVDKKDLGTVAIYSKVQGKTLMLYYSSPFTGTAGVGWKLPNSKGCFIADWIEDLKKTLDGNGAGQLSYIVSSASRSVSLNYGDSVKYLIAYTDISPIATVVYQDKLAVCDQFSRKVYGFQKITALDNNCYIIPDAGEVYIDGYSQTSF